MSHERDLQTKKQWCWIKHVRDSPLPRGVSSGLPSLSHVPKESRYLQSLRFIWRTAVSIIGQLLWLPTPPIDYGVQRGEVSDLPSIADMLLASSVCVLSWSGKKRICEPEVCIDGLPDWRPQPSRRLNVKLAIRNHEVICLHRSSQDLLWGKTDALLLATNFQYPTLFKSIRRMQSSSLLSASDFLAASWSVTNTPRLIDKYDYFCAVIFCDIQVKCLALALICTPVLTHWFCPIRVVYTWYYKGILLLV